MVVKTFILEQLRKRNKEEYMLYISGTDGVNYTLVDSDRHINSVCTGNQIIDLVKQGAKIGGVIMMPDGTPSILCKSQNFLYDFANSVIRSLATMTLMTKTTTVAAEKKRVETIAKQYGVIDENDTLNIDVEHLSVLLPYQDMIMRFDGHGKYEFHQKNNMVNVMSKEAINYSRLGFEAFQYMYFERDGIKYTLKDATDLLYKVTKGQFRPNLIKYVGVTPSNYMFKFMFSESTIYSVQFDTMEKVKKFAKKEMNSSMSKGDGMYSYWRSICDSPDSYKDTDLGIRKCSLKAYNRTVEGLHEKYPTLHDVYLAY